MKPGRDQIIVQLPVTMKPGLDQIIVNFSRHYEAWTQPDNSLTLRDVEKPVLNQTRV